MTTSNPWHSAPGLISDKLYRVYSGLPDSLVCGLEVQHVPGHSEWTVSVGEVQTAVLIARLRDLVGASLPRNGATKTLARLTRSADSYETSTDNGATWQETSHPYALARRVLDLDPAG